VTVRARRKARRFFSTGDLRFPVVAFFIWRAFQAIVLQAFGGASAARQFTGLPPIDHPSIFLWDGAWYQRIMVFGYAPFPGGTQQPAHFFPLLPWTTKAVQSVVRSEVAAALIVTNLAALAAVVLVFKVIATWKDERIARYAVVLMLAFPSSFFLWQFYTEGLFIALVAGALLAQMKDKMWLAGLLAAGATMTRPPGFLLVVVLAIGVFERRRSIHRDLAWAAAGLLGFLPIMVAQWLQAGSPLAYVSSQAAWGHRLTTPWHALTNSLSAYLHGSAPGLDGWAWSSISNLGSPRDLVAAYLFLALTIVAFFRKWPWTARTTLLVMTLFPLAGGIPLSMNRYVLAAWPGFGVLGELLERAPRVLRFAVIAGFAATSVLVLHDFSRGLFVG
jgi:4-amino-4-deoxy-L-arabinose transferase-like glycosyltransferase